MIKMDQQELIIKQVVEGWYAQLTAIDKLLNSLSDEQLMKEIAPGKNRGVYLLGHLVAVHDRMLPLLGLGEQLYPVLHPMFIRTPDRAVENIPSIKELRADWIEVNEQLNRHFATMNASQWLQKHESVSEEDFVKEPHRNKLNVLISRTNHLANHIGQLLLLK